jgi:phage major head subunit gpT-like protein
MNERLEFLATIDLQAADSDRPPRVKGLAYSGSLMPLPWGMVVVDLAGMVLPETLPLCADHDPSLADGLIGSAVPTVRNQQLFVEGNLIRTAPQTQRILDAIRAGVSLQMSIGAESIERQYLQPGDKITVNGKTQTVPAEGAYLVTKSKLREVSIVSLGADSSTNVSVAASKGKQIMPENNDIITSERSRVATINATCDRALTGVVAEFLPHRIAQVRAEAVNDNWTKERLDAALLQLKVDAYEVRDIRAERPTGPSIHASRNDGTEKVVECAFARSCGVNVEKHYKPEVLEAADRSGMIGIGIQELIWNHAVQAGYQGGSHTIRSGNMRGIIKAAFSTNTLTTILTNTGNKVLLDGFNSGEQAFREVAKISSVSDFKQATAYRLNASLEYEEVGPAGEIKHGTLSQESYTLQAKTYAKMLALTRTDIINDDLGAFADLRNRLGLGAALKLNKVFWSTWLAASAGAAFWTAGRGNLSTSSALSEAGLTAAVAKFRSMQDGDGSLIGLTPKLVLVPPELEATAKKLYASMEIRDTTSSTKYPTANIYQGQFKPVVSAYLSSSALSGYSTTNWWLLADPAVIASIDLHFLNGVQNPTIESTDADFDTLGIQFRGYHDFGVAMSEYRASTKCEA